jgi:hypothetical protein
VQPIADRFPVIERADRFMAMADKAVVGGESEPVDAGRAGQDIAHQHEERPVGMKRDPFIGPARCRFRTGLRRNGRSPVPVADHLAHGREGTARQQLDLHMREGRIFDRRIVGHDPHLAGFGNKLGAAGK